MTYCLPLQQAIDVVDAINSPQVATCTVFYGVKIDSRAIEKGDIFIAMRGNKVDGHDFIEEVIKLGAVAIIIEHGHIIDSHTHSVPIIQVKCTQVAFGQLARLWRTQLFHGKIIALTGSNGKTTIKNMLQSVLQTCYKTGATEGNYNNELGLPISIFSLPLDCDYWVLEMGARHVGDIDYLCTIAHPNITLVSNIGHAHIGEFGSREKQLQAKSAILSYGEVSILDINSPFYSQFSAICQQNPKKKILTIARFNKVQTEADLQWDFIENQGVFYMHDQYLKLKLNCPGEYNVHNAAWSLAIASYCGIDKANMMTGLSQVQPQPGRLQTIAARGFTLINDSYNASPDSVEALLKLKQPHHKVILIWGDMSELGDEKKMYQWHQEMAIKFAGYHIDWVLTYGELAKQTYLTGKRLSVHTKYQHLSSFLQIQSTVVDIISHWQHNEENNNNYFVYTKASNKMQFSRLVELLQSPQSE